MRLQKFLAHSGVASRRKSEEIIFAKRVKVNGEIIDNPAHDVDENDIVKVDNRLVSLNEKNLYYLLNKPTGVVSTASDEKNRINVVDFIESDERLYPVGRLDMDTSGLIILTNDGDLTNKLTHPRYELPKTYLARVRGIPTPKELEELQNGVLIDGKKTKKASANIERVFKHESLVKITIEEGRNRQVRKMFDYINHPVITLKRIKIGNIDIGNLLEGSYRKLKKEELDYLKNFSNENR